MEGVSKYRRCEVALIIHWILLQNINTIDSTSFTVGWDKLAGTGGATAQKFDQLVANSVSE